MENDWSFTGFPRDMSIEKSPVRQIIFPKIARDNLSLSYSSYSVTETFLPSKSEPVFLPLKSGEV